MTLENYSNETIEDTNADEIQEKLIDLIKVANDDVNYFLADRKSQEEIKTLTENFFSITGKLPRRTR